MCPQIAWIHPNLYKTKALTQILVWICSRVYETQEAHGPNSLHDKYSYQYKMLLILPQKILISLIIIENLNSFDPRMLCAKFG